MSQENNANESVKSNRKDQIAEKLRSLLAELLQTVPTPEEIDTPFIEMGANSLNLLEIERLVVRTYGIKVEMIQFFEELATIESLSEYIDRNLGPGEGAEEIEEVPSRAVEPGPQVMFTSPGMEPIDAGMQEIQWEQSLQSSELPGDITGERVMEKQLQLMSQLMEQQYRLMARQLEVLNGRGVPGEMPLPEQVQVDLQRVSPAEPGPKKAPAKAGGAGLFYGKPVEIRGRGLTEPQQQHLETLIDSYTKRTGKSRQMAAEYRPILADSRATVGFRFSVKEMLYPLVGKKSRGSRIWDIDGNEYIDLTMGFGVTLFGHHPDFIKAALAEQPEYPEHLGPRSHLVGEVAKRISKLTGMERVTFCNTGTEAVMTAMRLARAATGRLKIVIFEGSYHGHSDGTAVMPDFIEGKRSSIPVAPGIPQNTADNIIVLEYGTEQSLAAIKAHAGELAAVLVEPVQTRNLANQPREFLHQLGKVTEAGGIALIFDEMVSGFRLCPGGAQEWFGVKADIATYGKVIGGGLPIGVVAGKSRYMDGIDGGMWQYGDGSYPGKERTFFGGTFCQHPLVMTYSLAVLEYLEQQGPALQENLNRKTEKFARRLNAYFEENQVPMRVVYFGSVFRFEFTGNLELFFYHMVNKGVYIWEWRSCFMSTAHTEEDLDNVFTAVKETIEAMKAGGFISKQDPARGFHLLTLAGETEEALEQETKNMLMRLKQSPGKDLGLILRDLRDPAGAQNHKPYRRMVVCKDAADALKALEPIDKKRVKTRHQEPVNRPVAFMFPGIGDHYIDMGRGLYRTGEYFREQIDRCADLLKPHLGQDIRAVIYPHGGDSLGEKPGIEFRKLVSRETKPGDEASEKLNRTIYSHPAVFMVEYAMAGLLMKMGIQPQALIGYSLGEYTAACIAGVISLEDAMRLVCERARMIEGLPGGAMLAVPLPEERIRPFLTDELSLAILSGPLHSVVAGPPEAVAVLEEKILGEKIVCRRLQNVHAVHSRMMEPLKEEFTKIVKTIRLKPPEVPYISNLTGTWITGEEATDPRYWAQHTCRTVRFGDGLSTLYRTPGRVLVEVGPGQSLASFAVQHPAIKKGTEIVVASSMRHMHEKQADEEFFLNFLGRLWLRGIEVNPWV